MAEALYEDFNSWLAVSRAERQDNSLGLCMNIDADDYVDTSKIPSPSLPADTADDYDQYEIIEVEDIMKKTYHCSARTLLRNDSKLDRRIIELLDDNGILSLRPRKYPYQVRHIRQKMCQAGFVLPPVDNRPASIHKRFKNVIRLMVYNTPGLFPGLRIVRSDLDRKRKREPQIWYRFEISSNPLTAEFDFDNYFVTISGDFGRIQAFSKLLVALKMHKRLNNFNDSVSYKINLDLGIMEIILSNFGVALMKDKSTTNLMVKALNGIRTEMTNEGDVQIEFEESMKDAVDQIDPLLYSSIWLQSMAEKLEVVKMKEKSGKSSIEKSKKLNNHAV